MAQAQAATTADLSTGNRLVWVINTDVSPYRAEFQGIKIQIPGMAAKTAKHVRDGGNLMEYLAARKFISDLKQPQSYTDKGVPIFGPKALQSVELTEEELQSITGKTKADLKKAEAVDEKKARKVLTKELAQVKNKVSLADQEEP